MSTTLPSDHDSGFRLMAAGDVAYQARLVLTNTAQRSLDLQYYWVADDGPTRTLFAAFQRAADRGVRVRLLLDDLSAVRHDTSLARFARQPNVQVRLFNPFAAGRASLLTRMLFSIGEIGRLTRRMHNKLFIADNALAIVGGRNLTAEYFSDDQDQNFADLDALAAGPVVRRLSDVFDEYWNSDLAYPIEALVKVPEPGQPDAHGEGPAMAVVTIGDEAPGSRFDLANLRLVRAPSRVLADRPQKAIGAGASDEEAVVYRDVLSILRGAKREVAIMSPYFVPADDVMDLLRALRTRGVTVRVLTNSLASTDMPPVHALYARYRVALLQIGVELYELRPEPGQPKGLLRSFTSSRTALHAKAVLVDQRIVFVGSMNLDPRSKQANTEDGLVLFSPELGAQLGRIFARGASPENSYALHLKTDGRTIEWVTQRSGGEVRYSMDPDASILRRFLTSLFTVIVPEHVL